MLARGHFAVIISAVAVLLPSCGGSQSEQSMPMPEARALAPRSTARHLSTSYQELFRFHYPSKQGAHPAARLLDVNDVLYGTTLGGGAGKGTVYSISASGEEKILYRFRGGSDGLFPRSGLIDMNGVLYGTTPDGGSSKCSGGCGTVYSISTSGTEKVLYAFKGRSDGASPYNGVIAVNGTLYGTTTFGGIPSPGCHIRYGCGTFFSVTTSGHETVLHRFIGADGQHPGPLIDVRGVLYGTAGDGGTRHVGTVFSVTLAGVEKVLYTFRGGADGINPEGGLIDVNGALYGTTMSGGQSGLGTVFRISSTGAEKLLHSFAGGLDGAAPSTAPIDVKGVLYGTTAHGGSGSCFGLSCGTIYSVTPSGVETVLYSFRGGRHGAGPDAMTNINGALYGTTVGGGYHDRGDVYGYGTVFSFFP